jgi:ectoine hydroxylase-related dioxygenase (phytanoyl-CoA dioxygenase family)
MADGTRRCVRVRWALDASPLLKDVVTGPAYARIEKLFEGYQRTQGAPFSCEALIKPAGKVASVTDLPWHRDCAGIGCGSHVPAFAVGFPLSATNEEVGMLRVVAGSHRASCPAPEDAPGYDSGLPVINLPTQPGDLTIHVSCTLHGTLTSTASERTVVYQSFGSAAGAGMGKAPPAMLAAVAEARGMLIKRLTAER